MFALNLLENLRNQARRQITRPSRAHISSKAKFKDGGEHSSLNDVPIPSGSWKEYNARRQSGYMKVMLSGIAALIGTIIFVYTTGEMELNATVPDYPYEEEK